MDKKMNKKNSVLEVSTAYLTFNPSFNLSGGKWTIFPNDRFPVWNAADEPENRKGLRQEKDTPKSRWTDGGVTVQAASFLSEIMQKKWIPSKELWLNQNRGGRLGFCSSRVQEHNTKNVYKVLLNPERGNSFEQRTKLSYYLTYETSQNLLY